MPNGSGKIDREARIVIVGAGPSGLSTAWFLMKNGFYNVTVLEKLGRVGGLAKSITVDGMSYDIGANYVTWDYQETLKIAKEVGADTYPEEPYTSINLVEGGTKIEYRPFEEAILWNPYTEQPVTKLTFFLAAVRYFIARWKLSDVIDIPDYLDKIDQHPELCVPFKAWLEKNDLVALASLFQFPITVMGYGQLDDIATPYALRYMSLRTFFPTVFGRLPFVSWIIGSWPRRFKLGFQRMWEQVAWRTNVRLNVNITKVERSADGIHIDYKVLEQDLNDIKIVEGKQHYDYLILACPLTPDVFAKLRLERNPAEKTISDGIAFNPYCMTTFWVTLDKQMPNPIAPVTPIPERGIPWAVARQFQNDGNMFTQFYTRPAEGQADDEVIGEVKNFIKLMGGTINETQGRWHTFDKFTYFQHFSPKQIADGIYTSFAKMQGEDKTFYVGGATDFELIEPIVKHSKYIVEKHFA